MTEKEDFDGIDSYEMLNILPELKYILMRPQSFDIKTLEAAEIRFDAIIEELKERAS